ncbi:hypothetical protein AB1E33_28175 [Ruegeria sp. 2012CJ15-1]
MLKVGDFTGIHAQVALGMPAGQAGRMASRRGLDSVLDVVKLPKFVGIVPANHTSSHQFAAQGREFSGKLKANEFGACGDVKEC